MTSVAQELGRTDAALWEETGTAVVEQVARALDLEPEWASLHVST
jgi:hypothetical protein